MFVQRKYFVFLRKLKKTAHLSTHSNTSNFCHFINGVLRWMTKNKDQAKEASPRQTVKKVLWSKTHKSCNVCLNGLEKPAGEILLSKTAWLEFLHTDTRINALKEAFFLYQSSWLLLKPGPETLLEKLTLSSIGLRH